MLDGTGRTWTFDVCTNTWHEMDATGVLPDGGSLVYDVDSDRTIVFGDGEVWVYDRHRNAWYRRDAPASVGGLLAIYDPVSGLIITMGLAAPDDESPFLSTYDVDTDDWTATAIPTPAPIVGYSHDLDRIIGYHVGTHLIDPRTGAVEVIYDARLELIGGAIGSPYYVTNGTDTAYVLASGEETYDICGFDAAMLEWRCFPNTPDGKYLREIDVEIRPYDAIVYDHINERLVFIGGEISPWSEGETVRFDDVWSLDPDTGEWRKLLAPSS